MKRLPAICAAGALVGGVLLFSQTIPEPRKKFGASITGAFEGWFTSDKDARTFLVGYFNRNTEQEMDIPIGPTTRLSPGGPAWGRRRISAPAGGTECSRFRFPRISRRRISSRGQSLRTA